MILLDNSAWSRASGPAARRSASAALADHATADRLATCLPFLLEVGFSAHNVEDRRRTLAALASLPRLEIDARVSDLALEAHADLTAVGHHRLPPVDILIAAIAARHGAAVLHYDKDYDVLAEKTRLEFESMWVAPRGTL